MEIWAEKYRPKKLDKVVGQDDVVDKLKGFVKSKNMPHLIFAGPAGVGKTTCALAMARELYGKNWKSNFLELNASDERKIETIRTKVKDFARTMPLGDVPFKIILLDEADALTKDAQQALRRIMESYASTCRFILSCNFSSKIIPPIQSRCAIFRFKPLSFNEVKEYVKRIERGEKIKVEENALEELYEISNGDLRMITNILQSCAAITKTIKKKDIYQMAGIVEVDIKPLIKKAIEGKMDELKKILLELMYERGLSGLDIVKKISNEIINSKLKEEDKLYLMEKIGDAEFRIMEGSDEYIQLLALLSHFYKVR